MNIHHILLVVHLVCASVWVGGHLFLAICILPKALKNKDVFLLRNFKNNYEPIGMPSLILLVVTGIWMSYNYNLTLSTWFSFSNAIERVISVKLILLLCTFGLAVIADRIIFPKLNERNILRAGIFIYSVTLIGMIMIVLGSFIRYGGI